MKKLKEPVRLRQKKLSNGNISLYLDIYNEGVRSYEFLKLYIIPEKSREDRDANKNTLSLANAIKSQRIVELQNKSYGYNKENNEVLFFDYYRSLCEERAKVTDSRGNWGNWTSCLKYLERYEKNSKIRFKDITKEWIIGFRDFLNESNAWSNDKRERTTKKHLSKNTKCSYFNKLRACINQAVNEGILHKNPMVGVGGFPQEEGTRMYLTIEELKKLSATECEYPNVKRAFLFSCLTGLRRSDILNLKWSDVSQMGDLTRIIFKQKKTKGQEYLDITPQAAKLIGERKDSDDNHIFGDILSPYCTNEVLRKWVLTAGIQKNITFHCGRHTFATMMIELGTDIYVVSKLLGHKELSTTQIYAKVLDHNKQSAVRNIPDIL